MHYKGEGTSQNYLKAKEYYQKAANQGDADALVNLGVMYDRGYGVPKDFKKARGYFEKAMNKGSGLAKIKLGLMYLLGEDVTKDNAKALSLFEQGCKDSPQVCDIHTYSVISKLKAQQN